MKFFLKILPFIGVFIFGGVVAMTILFAEGYQYDFQKKDIVKKGVVYFKGKFRDSEIFLDGQKLKEGIPSGELRIIPGPHDVEIKKKGYAAWQKHIIVPSDRVVEFAPIRLLPENRSQFTAAVALEKSLVLESGSSDGILVSNRILNFIKYYFLNSSGKFWVKDFPVKFKFSKLTPVSEKIIVGLTSMNRIFYYDFEKRKEFFIKSIQAVDLKMLDGRLFALDKNGKVFELSADWTEIPKLFLDIAQPAQNFARVQNNGDFFAFLIYSKGKNIFIVVKSDGGAVFQKDGVSAAYIENDKAYYVKDKKLIVFDLNDNSALTEYELNTEIKWLSRIGDSYHALFLTGDLDLLYCDEDFENCKTFAKLDSMPSLSEATFFIESAENKLVFITKISGDFTLLDFAEESFFPRFLEDLISGVF